MPQGIEVYNADGSLQFNTGNRLYRLLQISSAGVVDGSVSVPELATGTPAVVPQPVSDGKVPPIISVAGTTVSWTFGSTPSGQRDNSNITIGVY